MPKQKEIPPEDLIIPPQDSRICTAICVFQMTAVLSSVALVYLTVAIYMPTLRAFQSGVSEVPAMCTTISQITDEDCDWGTCGEWCLSKSTGSCQQVYVNLRNNGSELIFENCTNSANKTCYGIDKDKVKQNRCILDECKNLTGTFNCTEGMCINITDAFECLFTNTDEPLKCSGRRGKVTCMDLHGLQNCVRGTCEKILPPYNCDRRCIDIPTRNKNVILLSGDTVFLSLCQRAIAVTDDEQKEIWNEDQENILVASCYTIENTTQGVIANDCINGTLLSKEYLTDYANFTYLNYLSVTNTELVDPTREFAPPEIDLIIANDSRLHINMEGCVNTLRDECEEFFREYGKDGSDHNARARFPCFYSENDLTKVMAHFDLEGQYRSFLVACILPSILFVVSCTMLVICQKTIEVGDDAKMRFKGCAGSDLQPGDKSLSANNLRDGGGGDSVMAL